MAKKFLIVLLVLLVIGLAGCGNTTDTNVDNNDNTNTGDNVTPPQKEETYKITFNVDGSPVYVLTTTSNATIELPTAPNKPGKEFVGWYRESQAPLKNKIDSTYFVTNPIYSDITVYGHYVDAAYTVSFYSEGVLVDTVITNGNESILLPEVTAKDGYVFDGWYIDQDVWFKEVYPDTFEKSPIYADISLYAHFVPATEVELFRTVITGVDTCAIIGLNDGVVLYDLIIPSEVVINVGGADKVYTVESIYPAAFVNNKTISTLVIPNTVTKIYDNAFNGCTSLTSITVPNSVTSIDSTSFKGTSISNVTAPLNVIEHLNKDALVYLQINGGSTITSGLFKSAKNLCNVVCNSDLVTIESEAFYNCAKLVSVVFNAGLTNIGENAFYNCDKINEISLPASLATLDETAFNKCSGISKIVIDTDNEVFESNDSHCIVVKDDMHLVLGCKNTVIYEGIVSIGRYAFDECTGLKSIYIPWTVTSIAEDAFENCYNLSYIAVQENNDNYVSENNCLIELVGTVDNVEKLLLLGCQNSTLTDLMNIKEISVYAFQGCVYLESIYLPKTVSKIAGGSFDGCTGLKSVNVGNTELAFDGDVFATSTGIQTIVLPLGMNVNSIKESGVFTTCKSVKNLTVPTDLIPYFLNVAKNSITALVVTEGAEIADGLLSKCTNLTTVVLPASIESIGDGAFEGCKKLTSVKLASGSALSYIGYNAFRDCTVLNTLSTDDVTSTGLVVPAGVAHIGNGAFYNNLKLASVDFADGAVLTSIGYNVFAKCEALVSLTIPAVVTDINYAAFDGTVNVTVANVPAFAIEYLANCSKLTTLTVNSGTTIDSYALRDHKNLETLTIDCSTISYIDNRAFEGCTKLQNLSVDANNPFYSAEGKCLIYTDDDGLRIVVLGVKNAVIPEDVYSIASYAFSKSTVTSITIPDSVEVIEAYAFSKCVNLATLSIVGEVDVEDNAFFGCTAIKNASVPAYVIGHLSNAKIETLTITTGTEIEAYALKDCTELYTLVIADTVTTIGEYAFFGCDKLTNVTIPDSVTTIGAYAFSECYKLATVNVGSGVETIAEGAFSASENIKNVNVADIATWCSIAFADEYSNPVVYGANLNVNGVKLTALSLDSVEKVSSYAFNAYTHLTSLTLENVSVEANAFSNCDNLVYLEIKGDDVVLSEDALLGNKIKSAKLPTYALSIIDLESLATLEITSGTELVSNAFSTCPNIKTLTVHNGVETIAEDAFAGCESIETLTAPIELLPYIVNKEGVTNLTVYVPADYDEEVLKEFNNASITIIEIEA